MSAAGAAVEPYEGASGFDSVHSLVAEVSSLVSPPGAFVQLQQLMRSPTASAEDFGAVISRDPALTAKLLRLSNSAYFGLRARVETVSRAVTLIGMRDLYSLALSVSAVTSFSNIAVGLVNMDTFWRHSVLTATLAKALARHGDILHPERLFVAGLLHDVGYLVLFHKLAPTMQDLLLMAESDERVLYELEKDTLGFTHADVGAELFALWELPASIGAAAANHHAEIEAGEQMREVGIITLADTLAERCGIGALFEEPNDDTSGLDDIFADASRLDISPAQVEEAMASSMNEFMEVARAFTD